MPEEFERPGRDLEPVSDRQEDAAAARQKARAAGRDLLDRAVDKKDELKQRAGRVADERRTGVADRASSISRALHGAANTLDESGEPQLSDWVHQAAGQVERVADYLQGKRVDGMADDLEELARNNPALFLGGTYVAGFALGRFLRATSPERRDSGRFDAAADGPVAERFDRSGGEEPSVTGNLGSTGWSGVGVAPGAFTAPERERAAGEPVGSPRTGRSGGDTARGAGSGSVADVFGVRDRGASAVRPDFRTSGTSAFGTPGMGVSGVPDSRPAGTGSTSGPGTPDMSGFGTSSTSGFNAAGMSASSGMPGDTLSDTGSSLAGSAAGSTDSPAGPAESERSARAAGFSEQHVVQTDRDLHEAPPRTDRSDRGNRSEATRHPESSRTASPRPGEPGREASPRKPGSTRDVSSRESASGRDISSREPASGREASPRQPGSSRDVSAREPESGRDRSHRSDRERDRDREV